MSTSLIWNNLLIFSFGLLVMLVVLKHIISLFLQLIFVGCPVPVQFVLEYIETGTINNTRWQAVPIVYYSISERVLSQDGIKSLFC